MYALTWTLGVDNNVVANYIYFRWTWAKEQYPQKHRKHKSC